MLANLYQNESVDALERGTRHILLSFLEIPDTIGLNELVVSANAHAHPCRAITP
jgi:hypothetical protein